MSVLVASRNDYDVDQDIQAITGDSGVGGACFDSAYSLDISIGDSSRDSDEDEPVEYKGRTQLEAITSLFTQTGNLNNYLTTLCQHEDTRHLACRIGACARFYAICNPWKKFPYKDRYSCDSWWCPGCSNHKRRLHDANIKQQIHRALEAGDLVFRCDLTLRHDRNESVDIQQDRADKAFKLFMGRVRHRLKSEKLKYFKVKHFGAGRHIHFHCILIVRSREQLMTLMKAWHDVSISLEAECRQERVHDVIVENVHEHASYMTRGQDVSGLPDSVLVELFNAFSSRSMFSTSRGFALSNMKRKTKDIKLNAGSESCGIRTTVKEDDVARVACQPSYQKTTLYPPESLPESILTVEWIERPIAHILGRNDRSADHYSRVKKIQGCSLFCSASTEVFSAGTDARPPPNTVSSTHRIQLSIACNEGSQSSR